jgi:membrane-bound lytic murein transglycosylase B
VSTRRRTTLAVVLALAIPAALAHAVAARPQQGAPPSEAGTTEQPTAAELIATKPVDTPGLDPVLDDVDVVETAAIRRADERLATAAAAQNEAVLRLMDAQRTRAELADRASRASQLAADAQAAYQLSITDQAAKEQVLADRQAVEAGYKATLDDRTDELRSLAATLFATAPEDRYAVLGSLDDITEAERRAALRERGSDLQLDRVAAARKPWSKARKARIAAARRVARARFATKTTGAEANKTADERDRSDELLRAADAAVADAGGKQQAALARVQDVLADRRAARLESTVSGIDVPLVALDAYWRASQLAPCRIPWWVIAGIGRVESGHGSAHGSSLTAEGDTTVHILGIALDGRPGVAAVGDTDGGRLDGDARFDRAVGPMQFLPGTWNRWATDRNADGEADPHNIYDAAGAAARYLCYSRGDLDDEAKIRNALLAYNRSVPYGTKVLAEGGRYRDALELPDVPESRPADIPPDGGN